MRLIVRWDLFFFLFMTHFSTDAISSPDNTADGIEEWELGNNTVVSLSVLFPSIDMYNGFIYQNNLSSSSTLTRKSNSYQFSETFTSLLSGLVWYIMNFSFSLGGDPSYDVCCPDIWSSSDRWEGGRHFPAKDQVGGGGPQGAAPWYVNPCQLQAQPNKPPHTNSGCSHMVNITLTAVLVLLYWLTRINGFVVNSWVVQWTFVRLAWIKDLVVLWRNVRLWGFWCWSLDQKWVYYNLFAICHFLHTIEKMFHQLWDDGQVQIKLHILVLMFWLREEQWAHIGLENKKHYVLISPKWRNP